MDADTSQRGPIESPAVIDLRVEFSGTKDGATLATIRRGRDSAAVELTVPDTALVVARLATRDLSAPVASPAGPAQDLEAMGGRLFEAVFKDDVREMYDRALTDAAATKTRVRVTLDFEAAPHLLGIPWELLYDDPLFIATQPDITVVREVKTTRRSEPLLVTGTVRILGITCSPSDMEHLDVEAERKRVEGELEELTRSGLAEITWLDPPTANALQQALRDGFHVLHYVGHSRGPATAESALILEKEDGQSQEVTGSVLANMIGRGSTLRLAVLNSCRSASVVPGDPFSAIATKLISVGIPAVVAMQLPVLDAAAVAFGGAFYRGLLLEEARIEEAVASGRLALLRSGYDVDWLAPVLFVDAPDTNLLDLSLVGWYTLNGTEPLKRPGSEDRISYGAGFLGLSVFDNLSRALALLGPDADTMEYEGQTHRLWRFQDAANVAVSSRDDVITSLSVNIDADDPGDLRLWLPGGLLLGEATLADTVGAMRTLTREYAARVGNVAPEAVGFDVESIQPSMSRTMPENFLMESWKYVFPSPEGGIKVTFGTSTAAGRWQETPSWFSFDMDLQHRIISSCEFATRGPDEVI